MDTIVALSTPVGKGAIAIVRLSGLNSIDIANKIFDNMPTIPSTLKVGNLKTKYFTDQAMCAIFMSPHSFTGENMVEFHCHGGIAISEGILNECTGLGCRMAFNGEFSKRAFLNGKLNLSSAEGIIEMIDAETQNDIKSGYKLLKGVLSKQTMDIQDTLTDILAKIEVTLDYPEEDLEFVTKEEIKLALAESINAVKKVLDQSKNSHMVKHGVSISIVGKTNVGKSSLLNSLLQQDKAIVSSVAGTTRDVLEHSIIYKDTKFNFLDTAGIRDSNDELEKLGIERSKQSIKFADLVLYVCDITNVDDNDDKIFRLVKDKPLIKVYNKIDKTKEKYKNTSKSVYISAKDNINIDFLKETIYKQFISGQISESDIVLTNSRHIDVLQRTLEALICANEHLDITLDCVSIDISSAWQTLGEITGIVANEEIINRIFEKFCVGK